MSSSPALPASATKRKRSKFPQSFWVANTMEIFERLAWYGFFAVSSLYITGSRSEGALGFTSEQRGVLQGIVPFILYLLPVLFGALADRFGYKKTFVIAYSVMVPAYYLLGQFTTFGTFFMSFLFVAVGAAIFKPVITGTVARTTDETNSSMGFGIFYMMVNIGGFVGPIVAGFVRTRYGWDWVFMASSFWIACNFIWLFLFYKEPTTEAAGGGQKRSIKQVLTGIVEVLGNGRFFILIFGILIMLMLSGRVLSWGTLGILVTVWVLGNFLIDIWLRGRERRGEVGTGLMVPMRLGNWKFALYLLILSGFWTSFNQIFLTHPEFIRDFVDTRDMVQSARNWFGEDFARNVAHVNENLVSEQVGHFINEQASPIDARISAIQSGAYLAAFDTIPGNEAAATIPPRTMRLSPETVHPLVHDFYGFNLRIPDSVFAAGIATLPLKSLPLDATNGAKLSQELRAAAGQRSDSVILRFLEQRTATRTNEQAALVEEATVRNKAFSMTLIAKIDSFQKTRQLNDPQMAYLLTGITYAEPADLSRQVTTFANEYRQVNPEYIINVDAGAIVLFQVLVSFLIGFIAPLTAMVIGIVIAAVGIGMAAWTYTGWLVTLAITIFAFGEMAASPKSQEYVGRIAPPQKVAMYMGFYFWTVALGNIFGGLLSGELYGKLARDMGRPDIMWIIFGALGLLTAVILVLYDRMVLGKGKME